MTELLPTIEAETIRESLLDYLTTTFALADEDARSALQEFLADPEHGIFKGPYVRLRLPFAPAADGWRESLEWDSGFTPYGHQAAAFARLSSYGLGPGERPKPTIVTTGTGSGKTEAFLYPILDHVRRATRDGVTGTKALILYPMNALANDQAGRLAGLLTSHPELEGITAALYTGQDGPQRTRVSADGLITNRREIQDNPPDILLTNYKMLDQLLLRATDAPIWAQSATSLQYLVLDEFHTYDGAQGTDVSMLLRRLGMALKSHWPADDSTFTADDWARPLGRITPVATSATLGDKGDPAAMLDFARTVFGADIDPGAVITESRLTYDQWADGALGRLHDQGITLPEWLGSQADTDQADADLVERVDAAVQDLGEHATGHRLATTVLTELWRTGSWAPDLGTDDTAHSDNAANSDSFADTGLLLDLVQAHPLTAALVTHAATATSQADLVSAVVVDRPLPGARAQAWERRAHRFVVALLATLSHVRATAGRDALSVEVHLWVRELSRIDRAVSLAPEYLWSDDGHVIADDESDTALPALYCRHCGRSGWGVRLAPTGTDLEADETTIRASRFEDAERFRALIHAPTEGRHATDGAHLAEKAAEEANLRWFHTRERRLLTRLPDDEEAYRSGRLIPVLTHVGDEAGESAKKDTCPSCLQEDGIRFLGSAIATLLSVTLSTLFGAAHLDEAEKKALIFTDSVQDAAHRAGFVQSRSHVITLRTLIRATVGDGPVSLTEIVERIIADAGDDTYARYRLLPPDLADRDSFAPFWQASTARKVPQKVLGRVRRRLLLDVQLEFGLQAGIGRTLERTGSVAGEVDIDEALLRRCTRRAVEEAGGPLESLGPSDAQLLAWGRGLLTRLRKQGGVEHEWFTRYRKQDGNRWSIWGGRRRSDGMPAFPRGRPAPGYPRVGKTLGRDSDLEPVASARGWYALWTARVLGVPAGEAATLARLLLAQFAAHEVLTSVNSDSGAQIYAIPASAVVIHPSHLEDLRAGRHMLKCDHCEARTAGTLAVVRQLTGAPCLVVRCAGRLEPAAAWDNFYRRLYGAPDPRRVVAREHTSLLQDQVRLAYESAFKAPNPEPGAPNVLVATPTLEMGIDIGDLSTVMLSALPREVASYLQRVGRAGRLTGNALVLAYVTGRGDHLPRLGDPLSVIDGQVRPPATYLDAGEILHRQLLAAIADTIARDPNAPHPRRATEAIGSAEQDTYLGAVIEAAETRGEITEAFLAAFGSLAPGTAEDLRTWVRAPSGFGTSPLAGRVREASQRWNHTVATLQFRYNEIQASLPQLRQRAASPAASEDDKAALRSAEGGLRLAGTQLGDLRGEYWIGVLEEYGLLPNYTLLDDSVRLDVAISWIDPDSGEYVNETRDFSRASAVALRDFAPGATFYAGGYAITVDAVDVGNDAEAVRSHAFCASCGYVREVGDAGAGAGGVSGDSDAARALGSCPRCGDASLADLKQRVDLVELERVSSAISRERATIDDTSDDRVRTRYRILTAADVDPQKVRRRWFVAGYGFGAKYLRDMTLRWVNLGAASQPGPGRDLAGVSVGSAPMFRVCAHCGHQDTDPRANRPQDHRPWCPQGKEATEDNRTIALSRTLHTEGIVLRLPARVTLGDSFAVPSLATALLLGLRERLGGDPDHLAVTAVVDPTPAPDDPNPDALLLHDIVPGGTGYLAELADPEQVWQILHTAWQMVRACPCRGEKRLACHRCLLPFTRDVEVDKVSRASAERYLHEILTSGGAVGDDATDAEVPAEMAWHTTEQEQHFDPESLLEQRFREVFADRLETAGAALTQTPGEHGNRWTITLNGRRWTLEPQELMTGSRPDFVLWSDEPAVPDIVIFADGRRYHASAEHNRVGDDAIKRERLRLGGRDLVLAVTWQDLDLDGGQVTVPPWYVEASRETVMELSGGGLERTAVDLLTRGPIDFLMHWMTQPDPAAVTDAVTALGTWLPMFALGPDTPAYDVPPGDSLVDLAARVLDGDEPDRTDNAMAGAWVHHRDTFVLAARVTQQSPLATEVVALLDDRQPGVEHATAWREWLRVSNLLALRQDPMTITVRSLVDVGAPADAAEVAAAAVPVDVVEPAAATAPSDGGDEAAHAWPDLYEFALDEEKALIDLAWQAQAPEPEVGTDAGEGVPLDMSWPDRRVAIDAGLNDDERGVLVAAGWILVAADVESIRETFAAGGQSTGSPSGGGPSSEEGA